MKFFGYWTVLVALVISAVAAYYSIVGLVAIFAAAFVPIVIMGAALEVGKLTTAVWLHTYWDKAKWHVKSYLTVALLLLMFITSMGIFGFLSKAHIEQTAQATEGVAQLERIETQISRAEDAIARAETTIQKLENTNTDVDAGLEEKIAREQNRIDTAYDRIQPAIDEQKQLLTSNLEPYETQLNDINNKLALLQQYADSNEVKALQRLVGARADGQYGSGTAKKVDDFRAENEQKRDQVLFRMQSLRDDSTAEIARLRGIAENEIADSNKLISRLREQVGLNDNAEQIALDIDEQRVKIKTAETEIESLLEKKYALESESRKLEAEVGPVKYIAEMVYGENTDANTLEAAVRWVILILVMVFDPLAVVLIIAGITLIEASNAKNRKEDASIKKAEAELEELKVELDTAKKEFDLEKASQQEILDEMSRLNQEIENSLGDIGDYNPMVREHNREPRVVKSVKVNLPEFKMEEQATLIANIEEQVEEELEDTLGIYADWAAEEEMASDIHEAEQTEEPEQIVEPVQSSVNNEIFEDEQGQAYTVDEETGHRSYLIDQAQYELNKRAKQSKLQQSQVDATIDRMKADGYWPNVNMTGEIEELLANADPDTLEEVYKEITKDLNQKKEI